MQLLRLVILARFVSKNRTHVILALTRISVCTNFGFQYAILDLSYSFIQGKIRFHAWRKKYYTHAYTYTHIQSSAFMLLVCGYSLG